MPCILDWVLISLGISARISTTLVGNSIGFFPLQRLWKASHLLSQVFVMEMMSARFWGPRIAGHVVLEAHVQRLSLSKVWFWSNYLAA
jgi:hypothetical protein